MTRLNARRALLVLDYSSKLLVVISIATDLLLETWLTSRAWPGVWTVTLAIFVVAAVGGFVFEEQSAGVMLAFAFLTPALVVPLREFFIIGYGVPWMAALLGVILPRSIRQAWAIPGRWKGPLILWALVISLTWPVVVLRELDFTPSLIDMTRLPVSGAKVNPPAAIVWICDVAATLGVGILWFDWLVAAFGPREEEFRRRVLVGLGISWAIAVAVGLYQMFGNMGFLNSGLFASLGRASGTMFDANPFGLVSALGGPAIVAAASLTEKRRLRALAWLAVVASWLGVWASAGRTAFAAAFIASAFMAFAAWVGSEPRQMSRRVRLTVAIAAAFAAIGVVLAIRLPMSSGPLPRLRATLPSWSIESLTRFLVAMWNRDGYGLVASHLIGQFPLFGVGVGAFHILLPDDYFLLTRSVLNADNAQNWYRHQLAEIGLVGSIGWILWILSFGWFLRLPSASSRTRVASTIVKGLLVSVALVSLVGMPTQNVAVAVTLWTLVYWYLALVGLPTEEAQGAQSGRLGLAKWSAIWMVVALSVGGTAYSARHQLRVPQRAAIFGWRYAYGFTSVEPDFDVARPSIGWAGRHAVAVLAPPRRLVKLTFSVDPLNLAKGPVDVKVSCDGEPLLAERVDNPRPIIRYVTIRDGATSLMLETWVSRSVRLADYGMGDGVERGLLIRWEFFEPSASDPLPTAKTTA